MPNCFSLTRKSDLTAGPVPLREIDNEMCLAFGVVPDPENHYHRWVDTIGLALACGQSFDQIIRDCKEGIVEYPDSSHYYETKLRIAEYLNANYVPDARAEIGRR